MGWMTYVDGVRLDHRTWYFIQRVDDDLGADHPVLRAPSGLMLHPSEATARRTADELGESIESKPPYITDIDAALEWIVSPTLAPLNYEVLMMAWNVLVDLGALESPVDLDADRESPLEEVFHRLHTGTAFRDDPARSPEPLTWTAEELTLVARTLNQGVERLRAMLASSTGTDAAAAV